MLNYRNFLFAGAAPLALIVGAHAADFDIPGGDLTTALNAYSAQSGIHLMVSTDAIRGLKTKGVKGELPPDRALNRILSGTGLAMSPDAGGGVAIVRGQSSQNEELDLPAILLAQAAPSARAAVETVTVTSSKLGGADVQSIPISITALSQEQLTATQTSGGPDLVKQVPNLTFSKTNFTGYNIQIRGIGTQAISVTTDPAVAVAFNDIPFIRNHFFEQEFYDVSQVEVLRGPQGTLYGRNATAGVVNLISAKADRSVRSDGLARCRQLQQPPHGRHAEYSHRRRQARSARRGRMDQARWLCLQRSRRIKASMAAICGRAACRFSFIRSKTSRRISSGNISAKMTTAPARPSSFARETMGLP